MTREIKEKRGMKENVGTVRRVRKKEEKKNVTKNGSWGVMRIIHYSE